MVSGRAGRNTGVLMKSGRIVVMGSTDDFTGAEMRGGEDLYQRVRRMLCMRQDVGWINLCAKRQGSASCKRAYAKPQ